MSALSIQVPFPVFQGRDGQPLENGYIWIGEPNLNPQTNPVVAYYDEALTIVAPQPLRTLNGYVSRAGTPAQIYVDGVNFSILVQDSKGSMVYNFPEGTGISPNASGVAFTGFKGQVGFVSDLADNDGSDWIGFDPAGINAVARSAQDKMQEIVSVKDFGAVGNGTSDDTSAIQDALDSGASCVFIPAGTYKITSPLTVNSDTEVYGERSASVVKLFANSNVLNIDAASNVSLHDFAIDGNSATYTSASNNAVFIEWRVTAGANVRLENLYIHDIGGIGILGLAAVGTPSSGVQIQGCRVENTGAHGIILQDYISDVSICNNTVKATGLGFADRPGITASRYGKNVIVSNNICIGSASALGTSVHGISIDGTENATCIGNVVSGWKGYGIEIGFVTNGTFQGNSITSCTRASIALSGIQASSSKNVNVSIIGNTCNSGSNQGIYAFMTGGTGTTFHESIVISGNTINGSTTQSGIEVGFVNRLTVANNSVNNCFLSGLYVDNCKEINIVGNSLINNNCTAIKNVSSITLSGTTATVTSAAHGYSNGDIITIWGATPVGYVGAFAISNVTTDTFDYTTISGLASPAAGTIQCTKSNSLAHGGARVLWSVLTTKENCIFGINLIEKNAFRNVYDAAVNGLYGYINDCLILKEVRNSPPVNLLTSGVVANERDRVALFMSNNKYAMSYNNAGTLNYAVLDLDGSDTSWANGSTAP